MDGRVSIQLTMSRRWAKNHWPASDGVLKAFEHGGSSEIVARRLAGSTVVKALNHIGYHELEDRARPAGAPDRRATGVAADDPEGTVHGMPGLTHEQLMTNIELYGHQVIPRARELLS